MTGVNIGTLLNNSGFDRISIFKIDIEGAEAIIFSSDYESWIGKVENLVIELHNDECRTAFQKAISGEFDISEYDELNCLQAFILNLSIDSVSKLFLPYPHVIDFEHCD